MLRGFVESSKESYFGLNAMQGRICLDMKISENLKFGQSQSTIKNSFNELPSGKKVCIVDISEIHFKGPIVFSQLSKVKLRYHTLTFLVS